MALKVKDLRERFHEAKKSVFSQASKQYHLLGSP